MSRIALLVFVGLVLLLLAVGAWAVQGLRWVAGAPRRRLQPAAA